MIVLNIFALRSTDPTALTTHPDPIGPENRITFKQNLKWAEMVVCGWGAHGVLNNQGVEALKWIREEGKTPMALKLTKNGQPWHPLYARKDWELFEI